MAGSKSSLLIDSPITCVRINRDDFRGNINLSLFALVLKSADGEWPINYTHIQIHNITCANTTNWLVG